MKINSRYEPSLSGHIRLDRLFGQYHYILQGVEDKDISLDSLSSPLIAHINITDRCNLQCEYCYARVEGSQQKQLSKDDYMFVLDKLKENHVFMLYISGGEPSMNTDINSILKYAVDCGFVVVLLSNLVDINIYDISLLKNKLIKIQLGLNNIWDDEREQNIQLMQACSNFRKLKAEGVSLTSTIMIDDKRIDLRRLMDFLRKNKINSVRFGLMIREGQKKNYNLTPEYIKYTFLVRDVLKEFASDYPEISMTFQNESVKYSDGIFSRRMCVCEAGTSQIYIDSDGSVYPCPLLKCEQKYNCGSMLKQDLSEIWESEPFQEIRKIGFSETKCYDCDELCGVWCRGLVFSYVGHMNGHSPFCIKQYEKEYNSDDSIKI